MTGLPPVEWLTSNVYSKDKLTVSIYSWRCIFQCHQATIFTATILSQPQLITTMFIQLQRIKHINCEFVVLHTCTQTLFHTQHICGVQKLFRRANNTKILYFIEPFLIRSVRCKREHFLWWVLSRFILFNHCCHHFWSDSGSRYALKFQIVASTTSIRASNITTRWYFKLFV